MSKKIKPDILVGLRRTDKDPEVRKRLQLWIAAYGRGPFLVCQCPDQQHVTLLDEKGKLIRFGSTENSMFHVSYVESWRS